MRITKIIDQSVPICSEMSNAFIRFAEMTVSAVAIVTDVIREGKPLVGFGFNSNGRYSQSGILRTRIIPRLLQAPRSSLLDDSEANFDPLKAWRVMMSNEKPGGHGERAVAVAAVDMALWDIVAKIEEKPLYRVLAARYGDGTSDPEVHVYAAGGYYTAGGIRVLREEMRRYLDLGYETVKMKIGGTTLKEDIQRIEAVLQVIGKENSLAADANGRFDLQTAMEYSNALARYDLKWYEEPGDPLDFELLRNVASSSATPIATGENLFSFQDSRNLIRYGGLKPERDFLQMDPALSYGLVEYLRILEILKQAGWSARRCIPHGGHQMALHVAAGLQLGGNESYPEVFQPFGGFADGYAVRKGRVKIPEEPGIGIELKSNLYRVFREMIDK